MFTRIRLKSRKREGRWIAAALEGAWRSDATSLRISEEELARIAPGLKGSGAAGLAWWRIRNSELRESPVALELLDLYRFQVLDAALYEADVREVFALLRSSGIEPILIKGWAIARLYPGAGLRPSGDIDLYVHPRQRGPARACLMSREVGRYGVDLNHEDLADLTYERIAGLYDRSQLVTLGDARVRVMGAEDNLWFLCMHLLRHGAYRPLWLCDVAAALESRPPDFDWDYLLGKKRKQVDRMGCTLGLAHKLLGARVDDTPVARRAKNLPGWLVPTVIKQWDTPATADHQPPQLIRETLRHPARLPKAIKERWPDAIQATIRMDGTFNAFPRLAYQIGEFTLRNVRFLKRLPALLRDQGRYEFDRKGAKTEIT